MSKSKHASPASAPQEIVIDEGMSEELSDDALDQIAGGIIGTNGIIGTKDDKIDAVGNVKVDIAGNVAERMNDYKNIAEEKVDYFDKHIPKVDQYFKFFDIDPLT